MLMVSVQTVSLKGLIVLTTFSVSEKERLMKCIETQWLSKSTAAGLLINIWVDRERQRELKIEIVHLSAC